MSSMPRRMRQSTSKQPTWKMVRLKASPPIEQFEIRPQDQRRLVALRHHQ